MVVCLENNASFYIVWCRKCVKKDEGKFVANNLFL